MLVSVAVQTEPCEFDLSEVRSVTPGCLWPGGDEDASHVPNGYSQCYDGTLGKVKKGVKLAETEDDYSSWPSAKCARYDPGDAFSQEPMLQKCDTCGHEWNDGSQCEHLFLKPEVVETLGDDHKTDHKTDQEGEEGRPYEDVPPRYMCMNTFIAEGQEVQCDEETNGSSQLCHSCMQSVKRSFFSY
jgi:hypothetical protein